MWRGGGHSSIQRPLTAQRMLRRTSPHTSGMGPRVGAALQAADAVREAGCEAPQLAAEALQGLLQARHAGWWGCTTTQPAI